MNSISGEPEPAAWRGGFFYWMPKPRMIEPTRPTGQVSNTTTQFLLANGTKASFIFMTEDGALSAWNGGTVAQLLQDPSPVQSILISCPESSLPDKFRQPFLVGAEIGRGTGAI